MEKIADINCVIVDDEPLARKLILTHLKKFPRIKVSATFALAAEAQKYLQTQKPDILFLDIQLPDISGIEFLRTLLSPPKVILTTAYREFAIEGFDLNVVDYLLKPILFSRFEKALQKTLNMLDSEKKTGMLEKQSAPSQNIIIKSSHQLIKIDVNEILYIEALHKYVKIITREKVHTTLSGIAAMEKELPAEKFYRCHRSYIVRIDQVEKLEGNLAIVQGFKIPVSKGFRQKFIHLLGRKIQ